MKLNQDIYDHMIPGHRTESVWAKIWVMKTCVSNTRTYPARIYLLKVNSRNTRTRCQICSELTINTPERRQWRRSGVLIVNFEHIPYLLVFLLLTFNR